MLEIIVKLSRKDIDAAIIEAAEKEIIAGYRRDLTNTRVYYHYDDNAEIEYAEYVADVKKNEE